jgi:hypothetical protein
VLRKIFGPKKDEVKGEWRKLSSSELYDLYCSPNTIRVFKLIIMRWAGHVAHMEVRKCAYRIVIGETKGKIPLGRPRRM